MAATAADQEDELGWITFPSGQYKRERAVGQSGPGNLFSDHQSLSYDWAINAWVPAERALVSPDGASYVYEALSWGGYIQLVDAQSGKRRQIFARPAGIGWRVISWQTEGIYLGSYGGFEVPEAEPGLWLLDPLTGHVRVLDTKNFWGNFGGGVAWGESDFPDESGLFAIDSSSDNPILRLDLETGKLTKFSVRAAGEAVQSGHPLGPVAPVGDGDLIVWAFGDSGPVGDSGPEGVFRFTSSGQMIPLTVPPDFDYVGAFRGESAQPGLWLPLETGVGLYTTTTGFHVMARSPYGLTIIPMGDCR